MNDNCLDNIISLSKYTRLLVFRSMCENYNIQWHKLLLYCWGTNEGHYQEVLGVWVEVTIFTVPLGMTISAGWWSIFRVCLIRAPLSWHTLEVFMSVTVRVRVSRWSSVALGNLQNCICAGLVQLSSFFAARLGDRLIKGLCIDNFRQQEGKTYK